MADPANTEWLTQLQQEERLPTNPVTQQAALEGRSPSLLPSGARHPGKIRDPRCNGPTPMELGAMARHAPARPDQKKRPTQTLQELGVTKEQFEERKRSGVNLRCGAHSHLIRECPQMNRGPGGGTRLRHNQTH